MYFNNMKYIDLNRSRKAKNGIQREFKEISRNNKF